MKKIFLFLSTAVMVLSFFSCGGDDPLPPVDYTLYDKSEIIGTENGKVTISLAPGAFTAYEGSATTMFVSSNNNTLNLFIATPAEFGGPITASNFMKSKDDTKYTFNIEIGSYGTLEKTGGSIPTYINDWHGDKYTISKIIIKNMTSTDAIYDKASATISFTITGALEVYDGAALVASNTIVYKFTELKK